MKWNAIATLPETLNPALTKDVSELIRAIPREDNPGAGGEYIYQNYNTRDNCLV